jgi:hypothetical protein
VISGWSTRACTGVSSSLIIRTVASSSQASTADTKFDATDFRGTVPRFSEANREVNRALGELLERFVQEKEATPAQLALAWLPAKRPWIVPFPGTTKPHRLRENLGAAKLELSAAALHAIEAASAKLDIHGARYPKSISGWLGNGQDVPTRGSEAGAGHGGGPTAERFLALRRLSP